ncbi:MAG: sensor histidine kinase [Solirubrobacteraceae bacterium]
MKRSSTRRWSQGPWFDRTIALTLLIACEIELLFDPHRGGPLPLEVLLLAGMTIPIAWRRTAPLGVACVVVAVIVLASINPINVLDLAAVQVVLFIPPYSVAAYESRTRALIGLAVCAGGLELAVVIGQAGAGSAIFVLVICAASWGTGRALRSRRALAAKLRRTAERIASEREHRERLAVADERTRIARELQAVVARSVAAMIVESDAAQRLLDIDPAQADTAMAEIEQTGRGALDEMRRILGVLRDPGNEASLTPQPGVGALHELIECARATGREVELQVQGEPRPLPASVDLGIYRILQEVLATAPDATELAAPVVVTLWFGEADLALDVTTGGLAPISWPTVTMRERVALCGGELELDPGNGERERMRVRMPGALEGALA